MPAALRLRAAARLYARSENRSRGQLPGHPHRRIPFDETVRAAARLPFSLIAVGAPPAQAAVAGPALPAATVPAVGADEVRPLPLPDPLRAMIGAAIDSGERKDVEAVVALAKATNPRSLDEIDAITRRRARTKRGPSVIPVLQMLAAAMASKKDGDVEACRWGALAKKTSPAQVADIDALLVVDYRAKRAAEKQAAADAARAQLASARILATWKGEGQIGASHSSGNSKSTGLSAGAGAQGLDWDQRFRVQADYQRQWQDDDREISCRI